MNRRNVLGLMAMGAAAGGLSLSGQTRAQDVATPEDSAGIPPIKWQLKSIDANDDSVIPGDPSKFTVQFLEDGQLLVGSDCNGAGAEYSIDGDQILIENMISTLIFCDGSLEPEYFAALQEVTGWSISEDGSDQLALTLDEDGAQLLFSASLIGVVWQWQEFASGNGDVIVPDAPERYTFEILDDLSVIAQADCNSGKGNAVIDGSHIELTVATTRKKCADGSFYDQFMQVLDEATEYIIRDGKLHLNLPMDAGQGVFVAIPPVMPTDSGTPVA